MYKADPGPTQEPTEVSAPDDTGAEVATDDAGSEEEGSSDDIEGEE